VPRERVLRGERPAITDGNSVRRKQITGAIPV